MRRIFLGGRFLALLLVIFVVGYPATRLLGLSLGSHMVHTARGPMEIASPGQGPPVLIVHGVMGGYTQGLLLGDNLVKNGFKVIAVSRPGYMRTPLSTGVTPEQQADALAALLDTMNIPRVVVIGISAGGMSSIQLAVRHPERVAGLVLFSGVTVIPAQRPGAHPPPAQPIPAYEPLAWDAAALAASLAVRVSPEQTLLKTLDAMNVPNDADRRQIVASVLGDPQRLAFLDQVIDSIYPVSSKVNGIRNDLTQVSSLTDLPLDKIHVPTLIIHGEDDRILPFAGAVAAQKQIAGSVLFPVPGAGHIVTLGPHDHEVDAALVAFCRKVEAK